VRRSSRNARCSATSATRRRRVPIGAAWCGTGPRRCTTTSAAGARGVGSTSPRSTRRDTRGCSSKVEHLVANQEVRFRLPSPALRRDSQVARLWIATPASPVRFWFTPLRARPGGAGCRLLNGVARFDSERAHHLLVGWTPGQASEARLACSIHAEEASISLLVELADGLRNRLAGVRFTPGRPQGSRRWHRGLITLDNRARLPSLQPRGAHRVQTAFIRPLLRVRISSPRPPQPRRPPCAATTTAIRCTAQSAFGASGNGLSITRGAKARGRARTSTTTFTSREPRRLGRHLPHTQTRRVRLPRLPPAACLS
jgi:hypothetical protein